MPDEYAAQQCINWDAFTVPQLWQMVAPEGHPLVYDQVNAWGSAYDALILHASRLRTYRDDLAQAWPPESSLAAQACADHIDKLVIELEGKASDAAANYVALNGIATTLSQAKDQMRDVHEQWVRKEQAQQNESGAGKVIDKLTFWSDEDAWRGELANKAAKIMTDTDTTVAQYRDKMQVTPRSPYEPPGPPQPGGGSTGGGSGRLVAPRLPVPTRPVVAHGGAPNHAGGFAAGAVLAGETSAMPGAAVPGGSLSSGDSSGGSLVAGGVIGAVPGVAAGMAVAGFGNSGGVGAAMAERAASGSFPTGVTRPSSLIGRDGVIGGRSMPVEPPPVAGRMRPVPGVIGEQPAGAGRSSMPMAAGAGGRGGRREETPDRRFDPDTPWEVMGAVPPVILPVPEPPAADPGPGVIGRDR